MRDQTPWALIAFVDTNNHGLSLVDSYVDDFNWVTSEVSAVPLFDVQVAPGLKYFAGVQSITIYDYNGADVRQLFVHHQLSTEAVDN